MSSRLERAARELEPVVNGLREIVRVDVDGSGGLQLTAECANGTRWFTNDDRGLIELFPERDPLLPLAARLSAVADWRVLSYRPGRRLVIEVLQGGLLNVVKGHRASRSARAAVSQGIAEAALRGASLRVPRLLRHDGPLEALVFERLACHELELAASSATHFARLGAGLAAFQRDPHANDVKVFGPQEEFGVLDLWQRKVQAAECALPAGWLAARARLEDGLRGLPSPELGLAHRDLHDRQVFLVEDQVALLDFDLLCAADVALDAGNLVAHLRWRGLQQVHGADETSVQACAEAFLEGLGRSGQPGFEQRLAFYTASTCLRLALVYRLRPRWSALSARLVAHAGEALARLAPHG